MLALALAILRYLDEDSDEIDSEILESRSYGGVYVVQDLLKSLRVLDVLGRSLRKRKLTSPGRRINRIIFNDKRRGDCRSSFADYNHGKSLLWQGA
jgi:hypothetical protein